MSCMLRSDPMTFCDMYLQPEAAFEVIGHLGDMGCAQFVDMTPDVKPFQRNYVTELCRCAELERKLLYMEGEMIKDKISVVEHNSIAAKPLPLNEIGTLENIIEKWESNVLSMSEHQTTLLKNYLELSEMNYVLYHIGPLMGESELTEESIFGRTAGGDTGLLGRLFVLTGVVKRSRSFPFEMMMWRVSHGNIYYKRASQDAILQDPSTLDTSLRVPEKKGLDRHTDLQQSDIRVPFFPFEGQDVRKVAFLAVCQGEQLSSRLEKVCSGFHVNLYTCPQTVDERMDMMMQLSTRIDDLERVMKKTKYYRCKALRTVSKQWETWMVQIKKSKAIYHTMNMFTLDITRRCLIGQCWIPNLDLPKIEDVLARVTEKAESNVESFILKSDDNDDPPTYHRTNKFTKGFQALINAYGDSTYRELNPGLYTVITFPFLFAIMFGDFCHGLILLAFAGWMMKVEKEHMDKTSKNEIWNIFFGGRYVILMMAFFTMYTGFLYNEYFCKPLTLMTPSWLNTFDKKTIESQQFIELNPVHETNPPYIFGVDPVWMLAKNKIMYLNSVKMKMSIIIGIVHMMFGLILSLFNHKYFKRYYAIVLEFIPQILFLTCLFFWLVILIYMKWYMFSGKYTDLKRSAGCAPLILILFIDMVLLSTTKPVEDDCDAYMFEGQEKFQRCLVLIAVLCVPILLFGSPLYLNRIYKKKKDEALKKISQFRRYQRRNSDKTTESKILKEIEKYSTPFGELMIHQAVHTIEFVLSTISHTASYLRLWALSLAHEQLSEMLWVMVFAKIGLRDTSSTGFIKVFIIFAVWAVFSLSILVVMEGLSAFLHTLRLHWVEFMSKFYSGGGYPFKPFSFKAILTSEGKDDKSDAMCKKQKTPY